MSKTASPVVVPIILLATSGIAKSIAISYIISQNHCYVQPFGCFRVTTRTARGRRRARSTSSSRAATRVWCSTESTSATSRSARRCTGALIGRTTATRRRPGRATPSPATTPASTSTKSSGRRVTTIHTGSEFNRTRQLSLIRSVSKLGRVPLNHRRGH